jgi:hypothetical protein
MIDIIYNKTIAIAVVFTKVLIDTISTSEWLQLLTPDRIGTTVLLIAALRYFMHEYKKIKIENERLRDKIEELLKNR